jgi:large subunit ribosomal protein L17
MRRNMVNNLFLLGRIRTTPAKAKECRSMAEKMITLGVKGGLSNFRLALAALDDKYVVRQLFTKIAPRYKDRPGGYTRILHLSCSENRLGDNAPQVIFELLPSAEPAAPEAAEPKAASEKK